MAQPLVNRPLLIGALAFIFLVLLGLAIQSGRSLAAWVPIALYVVGISILWLLRDK